MAREEAMNLTDIHQALGPSLMYNEARLRLFLPILLLLTTSFGVAADVSGKWNGALEFKGEDGQTQTAAAHADLEQQNNVLTGTIWKLFSWARIHELGLWPNEECAYQ